MIWNKSSKYIINIHCPDSKTLLVAKLVAGRCSVTCSSNDVYFTDVPEVLATRPIAPRVTRGRFLISQCL